MNCCKKKKKIHVETPIPIQIKTPERIRSKSPSQHKKDSSVELKMSLEKYRTYHPNALIIDSPRFGFERNQLNPNFGKG